MPNVGNKSDAQILYETMEIDRKVRQAEFEVLNAKTNRIEIAVDGLKQSVWITVILYAVLSVIAHYAR